MKRDDIRASASREPDGWQYFVEILGGRAETDVIVDGPVSRKGSRLVVLTHLAVGHSAREVLDDPSLGITPQLMNRAKFHFGSRYATQVPGRLFYRSVRAGELHIARSIPAGQLPGLGPDSRAVLKYCSGDPFVAIPKEEAAYRVESVARELGVPNRPGLLGSIAVLAGLTNIPMPPAAEQPPS